MNMTVTNNDLGNVILKDAESRDELLTFAGAGTILEGTILARKAVADAVAASAFTGTGDGTVTLATVQPGQVIPVAGAYVLNCIEAVADGGVFELVDPNGALVATNLILTVGAGGSTVFETNGLQFTITDGTANFAVGDTATLTVAADGKMVPFDKAGAGGAQTPKAVVAYEVVAAGAGDESIRAMVRGDVVLSRLVIDADGDATNVDNAVIDELRDYGIVAVSVDELNILDNQ